MLKFKPNLFAVVIVSSAIVCASAWASLSNPEEGKEYRVLAQPQPVEANGKVEVVEFFAYWCPHCNVLDPILTDWVKKHGSTVTFKRVHIDFGGQQPLQRLFYTLETMGIEEQFHSRIFKAIHADRKILRTDADIQKFVAELGIDQKKYAETSQSFTVVSKIAQAKAMESSHKIDDIGVPTLSIDGRYLASPALIRDLNPQMDDGAGSRNMLPVLDVLVAKTQRDHGKK